MKRLNKILLVFLAITFLTLYGGWRFIHSEKFSREASLKVSKILTEKAGAKLSFSGVNFSLIPLSTTFKNVRISKHDPALLDIDIEAVDLEVAFTYSSFIASEPEIDEISLREGKVDLNIYKESKDDINIRKLKTKEIFAKYNEILSQIPVRLNLIMLENIDLKIDETSMLVNEASLFPQKVSMRVKADVSDLRIGHDSPDLGPLEISNIKLLGKAQRDEWRVEDLRVTKGENHVELRGVAFNEGQLLYMNSMGSLKANAEDILVMFKTLPKEVASIKGNLEGKFTTAGIIDNPDVSLNFIGRNADTEWAQVEVATGTVSKKKNLLWLDKFSAAKGRESYELKKPQAFFDFKAGKFTNFNFSLRVRNAFSNTFLRTIRSSLDVLKGSFTGDVEAALFDDKAVFTLRDKVQVSNFKLTTTDGKKDILSNAGFTLENSTVTVNEDFSVDLDLKAAMPNSKIQAKGKITDKRIDITTTDSKIDMNHFGAISGIKIQGAGPAEVKVSGPLDNVVFNFKVDWNHFSVLDLNFGKVKSEFALNLETLLLEIQTFEGHYNKTSYTASGSLGFDGPGEGMDLKASFKNASFTDTRKMLHLVFKNIKLPVDPEFNFDGDFTILGGFDVEKLKVDGAIRGSDLKVAGEDAEKISLKLNLANNLLSFRQIKINKSRGEISANVSVNLANNYIELSGGTQSFRLRDFNFYRNLSLEYDGDLFLDFDGNGTVDDFSSRFKAKVANAFIGNIPASSSNAIFYVNSNDIVTNASLLAGKIKVDSLMSFKTGIAAIKSSIDTNDMKEFLGIFSSHNINDKGISGRFKAQLNTQISMGSLGVRKFFLNIDQLILRRGDINLVIDPRYNNIEVDDGNVKKWDLRLRDGNEFIISKGRNISNGVIGLDNRFSLKASLLEVVAGQIERATGIIRGAHSVTLDKKITIKDFNLNGNDHSLKIRGLPGYITNLDYSVVKGGEIFEVTNMTGNYGEGDFKILGKIRFDDLYPEVALTYQIDRSSVPLFKRSSILISSNGTLTGTSLPYKLTGKVTVMHGEILDDPADLMKESKVSIDEYKKYLPEKDFLGNKGIIDLNLSFDIANPVVIKNNMAEVYFKGSGQLTGDVQSPEISTRLEIIPNVSKFKFKGHDFALNQGYVEIRDRGKNRISDLKFSGLARINDYDMKLDISGSISKVNIDLSSEPALAKEDLLSLLTFGVTSDMSKNLEAGERRFVTTVGIGTLLVDQLKINEDLNATLGVKLSVQPEFKEDETALLQGKSAVSEGNSSRLKSATKIKINKQINRRVDVSLSSTIGGSLEQKQEMNINFNINKNFSLEGVYEVKPTEEEKATTPTSIGADLKWRKSF